MYAPSFDEACVELFCLCGGVYLAVLTLLIEDFAREELLGGDDCRLRQTLVVARNLDLFAILEGLLHGVRR